MKKGALTAAILFVLVAGILGAVLLYSGSSGTTAAQTADVPNTDELELTACAQKTCPHNPITQTVASQCGQDGTSCRCEIKPGGVYSLTGGGVSSKKCIEPESCEGDVCAAPNGWSVFDDKCKDYGSKDANGKRTCGCIIQKPGVKGSAREIPCTEPTTTTTTMPTCPSLGGECVSSNLRCFPELPGKCPPGTRCCPPSPTTTTTSTSSTTMTVPSSTTSTTETSSTTVTTVPPVTSTTTPSVTSTTTP